MLYYAPWILLVLITVWIGLASFFWALESGQLAEQQRARYLPLVDDPEVASGNTPPAGNESPAYKRNRPEGRSSGRNDDQGRRVPREVWALLLIAGACLGLFSAPVFSRFFG